jgi:ribosomal protein L11 methylase PrmA
MLWRVSDALAERVPKADIVLANILLEPLVKLAPKLTAPRVIASGVLRSQSRACTLAFEEAGYVLREQRERDGWVALVFDHTQQENATMWHRPVL